MGTSESLPSYIDPRFCQNCGGELTPSEVSLLQCSCGYLVQLICGYDEVDMFVVSG